MKPALPALCTVLLFAVGAAWFFGRADRSPGAAGPSAASASENAPTPGQELVSPQSEPALAAVNERVVAALGAETGPSAATRANAGQPVKPLVSELPPLEDLSTSVAGATPDTRTDLYFEAKYAGFGRADYEAACTALLQVQEQQRTVEVADKNLPSAKPAPTPEVLVALHREIAWLKQRAFP